MAASVVLSPTAARQLDALIETLSLPSDTRERVRRVLGHLREFPLLGEALPSHPPFRFILGPWRWMLVVYAYDEANRSVIVATIEDARSAEAATSR